MTANVAVIGYGEVGAIFARDLRAAPEYAALAAVAEIELVIVAVTIAPGQRCGPDGG